MVKRVVRHRKDQKIVSTISTKEKERFDKMTTPKAQLRNEEVVNEMGGMKMKSKPKNQKDMSKGVEQKIQITALGSHVPAGSLQ